MISPAYAQFAIDSGVRAPKSVVVPGNSVIDNAPNDNYGGSIGPAVPAGVADTDSEPLPGTQFVDQPVKQVLKQHNAIKVERAINDPRIDDGYVQGLVKDSLLFGEPIE